MKKQASTEIDYLIADELLLIGMEMIGDIIDDSSVLISFEEDEGFCNDNEEDEYDYHGEKFTKECKLRSKFEGLGIAKTVQSLKCEAKKLEDANFYEKALSIKEELINNLPEHASTWTLMAGESLGHYIHDDFICLADSMMRAYVVTPFCLQ